MKKDLIFGLHAVSSAVESDPENIIRLLCDQSRTDKRLESLIEKARAAGLQIETVEKRTLDKMSANARHQSVLALYRQPKSLGEDELLRQLSGVTEPLFLLVLDGIQDPHNLGACLRTADAAGVHAVIAPKDRAVGMTPVVRKVAAGAAGRVPFYQLTNIKRTLAQLQKEGLWVIGAADEASQNYSSVDYKGSIALVLGAEEKGLRRLTRELCDELVSIPMAGSVSSLNVSVAAGVCLFEVVRQREISG